MTCVEMSIMTVVLLRTACIAYRDMRHRFFLILCLLLLAIDISTALFAVQASYEVKNDGKTSVLFRVGVGITLTFYFGG